MIVKDKFELIYGRSGDVYNIMPFSSATLSAYELDANEKEHVVNLAKIYARSKDHFTNHIVLDNIDSVTVVNFPDYPLPGFINREKKAYINVAVIPSPLASDYSSADIYSLYVYALSLLSFTKNKPFSEAIEEHISNYIFATFMRMFGKKAGLLGSYKNMIPKLRFLISLYVRTSLMGIPDDINSRRKLASRYYIDINSVNLENYDFSLIRDFLKSINENRIIPLSDNRFSTQIINIGGLTSLPIFEDVSRFFATMIALSVKGTSLFNPYWAKVRPDLYQKIIYLGSKALHL